MNPVPADARTLLAGLIRHALTQVAPAGTAAAIVLDRPKLAQHGDFACNIALQLAKELRGNPRAIAQQLVAALPASPHVEKAEIAGAGFINLFLTQAYKQQVIGRVLDGGSLNAALGELPARRPGRAAPASRARRRTPPRGRSS